MHSSTHEILSRDETVVGSSERSFGIVMTAAFALLSLFNWWHDSEWWRWTGGIAVLLLSVTLLYSSALKPLNRLWLKLGLLLHKLLNPIMMAFVFFIAVVPTGFIMRSLGKDLLRLKREPEADSYWIKRQPPGPVPKSMKDQF